MVEFEIFWQTYPLDLCNRKGSKPKAEESWNKLDADTHETIITNMREIMRSCRKVKEAGGSKSDWIWPMAVTWLNQSRWLDIEDIKQTAEIEAIRNYCKCGKPRDIVNECWSCFDKRTGAKEANDKRLLANLEALGLSQREGESRPEWNARCYQWVKSRGGVAGVITRKQAVHD